MAEAWAKLRGAWIKEPRLGRAVVGHELFLSCCPEVNKEFPVEGVPGFGILRKNVAKYDDVKAALAGLGLEPQEALNQVAWESVLGAPVREVWAHDGKCACGKRTYLFGQCPSCIRQEVGERALADQEAREAAQADVVPEDGVPAVDLVGAVSGSPVSRVLLVKPR